MQLERGVRKAAFCRFSTLRLRSCHARAVVPFPEESLQLVLPLDEHLERGTRLPRSSLNIDTIISCVQAACVLSGGF